MQVDKEATNLLRVPLRRFKYTVCLWFVLRHHFVTLAATSDNLEAISEAASSHSAASDIENDNLSDMISANVSGRGTPSISGRDTPISQEESQTDGAEEERRVPNLPVTVQKTNREDVTDRFGKFDIKQELESKCLIHI